MKRSTGYVFSFPCRWRCNKASVLNRVLFPFSSLLAGLGCDRAFCSAYWHVQSLTRSDFHPICSPETFKPVCAPFLHNFFPLVSIVNWLSVLCLHEWINTEMLYMGKIVFFSYLTVGFLLLDKCCCWSSPVTLHLIGILHFLFRKHLRPWPSYSSQLLKTLTSFIVVGCLTTWETLTIKSSNLYYFQEYS